MPAASQYDYQEARRLQDIYRAENGRAMTYAERGEMAAYRARISCSHCGHAVQSELVTNAEAWNLLRSQDFTPDFGYSATRHAWRSRCRQCDRAASRRSAERRAQGLTRSRGVRGSETSGWVAVGDRRFGVEMELIFPASVSRYQLDTALQAAGLHGWRCKSDASLYGGGGQGWEIVSPILHGQSGYDAIRVACRVADELGARPTRQCGLHVHHEVRDLGAAGIKRLIRSYANNQDLIDTMLAPSRRDGQNQFCGRWSRYELDNLESRTLANIHRVQTTRYRTMNLQCYTRYGTVECRQHQGTMNPTKIVAWVKFVQQMIDAVRTDEVTAQRSVCDLVEAIRMDEDEQAYLVGRAAVLSAGRSEGR